MNAARLSEAQLGIAAAALSGDSGLLYRLAADLLEDGVSFDDVLFDVLLSFETSVGLRWQSGDYLVSEEHAATAALETVISLLSGSFDRPEDGPHVVVAVSQGDHHSLAARAVAASLLSHGCRAVFLGANVLASDVREFLDAQPPDAMVLSCGMSTQLMGARATIRESHAAGVPVLAGGKGFGPEGAWAPAVGADTWVPSAKGSFDMLRNWHPNVRATEARAHDLGEVVQAVIDRRHSVLAAAEEWLALGSGKVIEPRVRGELEMTLDAVISAAFVDDKTLLDEFVSWQRATLTGHQIVAPCAEAIAIGLAPVAPVLAEWVEADATRG
jgi:methanogenic corrinoid protein MtbC1